MLGTNIIGQEKSRLDLESNFGSDRIARPSVSRAFGPPVRSASFALQNRLNQDSRNNDRVNMSRLFKPFGLQTTNTKLDCIREESARLQQSSSITSVKSSSNVSTVSRRFGLESDNTHNLNTQNNSRLNHDVRNSRSSFAPTQFGLQMRSFSTLRDLPANNNYRLNVDSNVTSNRSTNEQFEMSNTSRIVGPAFRNTTLANDLQIQARCNDEIDSSGFRVPSIPRMIKGRNPITSSRLFSHQNSFKCKNLSNINGFDVSHISRRDVDSTSESRLGFMRNGWMDKQSFSGSICSTSSVKAQAMNLLETLHYSILNMGPYITVDAVTMEIEKVKQGLDSICETSFAPSVRDADAVSVISRGSKFNYPAGNDITRSIRNGECLNLKSSKEVLKSLSISTTQVRSRLNINQSEKKFTLNKSTENVEVNDNQEENDFSLKKPKPFAKWKKSPRMSKGRTHPGNLNLTANVTCKIINLKEWYPIAVGNDLALCGVDEQGVFARTDVVKKRVNNRKVELINGVCCNLIGSPSSMALVLPQNVASLIKNGLTSRWRVLQKQLLHCQTAEKEKQKRKSKSPSGKSSPMKLRNPQKVVAKSVPVQKSPGSVQKSLGSAQKSPRREVKRKKLKTKQLSPVKKVHSEERIANKHPPRSGAISSPKKRDLDVRTRSGRTIKPPSMFWLVAGNSKNPTLELPNLQEALIETPIVKHTTAKNSKRTRNKITQKGTNESHIVESDVVNSTVGDEESCKKLEAVDRIRKRRGKTQKHEVKQDEIKSRKESPEVSKVGSSTEDSVQGTRAKRKRDPNAETESAQRKKSKIGNSEVHSTVTHIKATANKQKQKETRTGKGAKSQKTKAKQQQTEKKEISNKKTVRSSWEHTTETKSVREMEEDFELQLDDIEIPQFSNLNGNPQLTRSQLRLISAETPPLKYFNSNLKVFSSTTPMRSPEWVISQRTESEVKQFQKRRAEAFKKKVEVKKVESKKTVVKEKTKSSDLKKVLEWVAEKTVQTPQWGSKVVQYVLPSRRQMEQEEDEEDEEDEEEEFL